MKLFRFQRSEVPLDFPAHMIDVLAQFAQLVAGFEEFRPVVAPFADFLG
ncbi:hypothetical protein P4H65_22510 [Paenibacillus chitinolyticus]|nr:hypothetical protein [Paenibacillus chitinolyticus]MEC0248581.1 hypothetical protein [Paenibacillus chitinolyticus]